MTFAIALVTTVVGFALVWIALPNKTGENPRWVRSGLVSLLYPVFCLTLINFGSHS